MLSEKNIKLFINKISAVPASQRKGMTKGILLLEEDENELINQLIKESAEYPELQTLFKSFLSNPLDDQYKYLTGYIDSLLMNMEKGDAE